MSFNIGLIENDFSKLYLQEESEPHIIDEQLSKKRKREQSHLDNALDRDEKIQQVCKKVLNEEVPKQQFLADQVTINLIIPHKYNINLELYKKHSVWFQKAFSDTWLQENEDNLNFKLNKQVIDALPSESLNSFEILNSSLQNGKLSDTLTQDNLENLLHLADYFQIEIIKQQTEAWFIKQINTKTITQQQLTYFLELSSRYELQNLATNLLTDFLVSIEDSQFSSTLTMLLDKDGILQTYGHLLKQLRNTLAKKLSLTTDVSTFFSYCHRLEEADFTHTEYSFENVKFPPHLIRLCLRDNWKIKNEFLQEALTECSKLEELNIHHTSCRLDKIKYPLSLKIVLENNNERDGNYILRRIYDKPAKRILTPNQGK